MRQQANQSELQSLEPDVLAGGNRSPSSEETVKTQSAWHFEISLVLLLHVCKLKSVVYHKKYTPSIVLVYGKVLDVSSA